MEDNKNLAIKKSKLRLLFEKTVVGMSFVGSVIIFITMLIIVYDIIMRQVFNSPFLGTAELIRNSIVIIVFLQITNTLMQGRHIRTTLIVDRLSHKGKLILYTFAAVLGLILFTLIAYSGFQPAITSILEGQYEGEGALRVPTFPARFAIVIGSIFMIIQFLITIYDAFKHGIVDDVDELDEEEVG